MTEILSLAFYQVYMLGTATGILLGYFILTKNIVQEYFKTRSNNAYPANDKEELKGNE